MQLKKTRRKKLQLKKNEDYIYLQWHFMTSNNKGSPASHSSDELHDIRSRSAEEEVSVPEPESSIFSDIHTWLANQPDHFCAEIYCDCCALYCNIGDDSTDYCEDHASEEKIAGLAKDSDYGTTAAGKIDYLDALFATTTYGGDISDDFDDFDVTVIGLNFGYKGFGEYLLFCGEKKI